MCAEVRHRLAAGQETDRLEHPRLIRGISRGQVHFIYTGKGPQPCNNGVDSNARYDVKAATTRRSHPRQRICFSSSPDGHERAAPFPFRRVFTHGLSWSLPHCILAYVSIRLGRGHPTRTLAPVGECQAHVLCVHAITPSARHNAVNARIANTIMQPSDDGPTIHIPPSSIPRQPEADGEDDPGPTQYVYDVERQCTLKNPVAKCIDRHI